MDRFKLLGFSLVMGLVGTLSAADAGAQTAVDAGSDATVSGSSALLVSGSQSVRQISQPGPRAPLSAAAASSMSRRDLLIGGYPLPVGNSSSPGYSTWLNEVSRQFSVLPGSPLVAKAARSGVTGSESSQNWSGLETISSSSSPFYDLVFGAWTVPSVSGSIDYSGLYASEWVGIDGDGCTTGAGSDLLQLGSETDIDGFGTTTTYAWVEYIPWLNYQYGLTNLTVSPNDTLWAETFIGTDFEDPDEDISPTPSGTAAYFIIDDVTTGKTTGWLEYCCTDSGFFAGAGAEAVVERTAQFASDGGLYFPSLANYGTTSIGMLVEDVHGNFHDFATDNTHVLDMCTISNNCSTSSGCNSGNEMSEAAQVNADTAGFTWVNYN